MKPIPTYMNAIKTAPGLPEFLTGNHLEVYFKEGGLLAVHDGRIKDFFDLPTEVLQRFRDEMENDAEALFLFDQAGIRSYRDQLFLYVKCRFGGYNGTADLNECGSLADEHWDCGAGCKCALRPLFRGKYNAPNGELTEREMQVLKMIAADLPGKQIAAELGVAQGTVDKHKQSIFRKVGVQTSVALTAYCLQENL